MIQPTSNPGVIILDDIRFDVSVCQSEKINELNRRGRPDFMVSLKHSIELVKQKSYRPQYRLKHSALG